MDQTDKTVSQQEWQPNHSSAMISQRTELITYGAEHQTSKYKSLISAENTHVSSHISQEKPQQMDLMFEKNSHSHSEFNSKKIADNSIAKAIANKAQKIAKWTLETPEYDADTGKRSRMALTVDVGGLDPDEISIGSGYRMDRNGKIRHYETSHIRILIERNDDDAHKPYCFHILTAYPDILHNGKPDAENCRSVLYQTKKYNFARAIEKVYLDKMADPAWNYPLRYDENQETLQLPLSENGKLTTNIYFNEIKIQARRGNETFQAKAAIESLIPELSQQNQKLFKSVQHSIARVKNGKPPSDKTLQQAKNKQQPKPFQPQPVREALLLKADQQKNQQTRLEPDLPSITEPKTPAKRIMKAAPANAPSKQKPNTDIKKESPENTA